MSTNRSKNLNNTTSTKREVQKEYEDVLIDMDMSKYEQKQENNKGLKDMDHQLSEMDHDYELMLVERVESRKQLEAKFQDISRKIKANKDFTLAEIKRVDDTLKAFQSRFEHKLRELRTDFENQIAMMRQHNRTEFQNANNRLDNLGKAIEKEVQDRITESDHDIGRT